MFHLESNDAEYSHLNLRKEKHGEDKVPAATLTFKLGASALILDSIDPKLRPSFYEKPGKGAQQALAIDGNDLTALKLPYLKPQKIGLKAKGYELTIASLLEHIEPLFFADSELVLETVGFIEGGSCELVIKVNTTIESEDYQPLLEAWDREQVVLTLTPPKRAAQQSDLTEGDTLDDQDSADAAAELARLAEAGQKAAA
ncbi:hypothetical protein [Xanthomonas sp. BRIP62411]|uniref:hypothetical protein n=1 Tax=Xanthomonas sp. BRIP62411 TaxID=2182389 RepID=UPI000F8D4E94|nr:hypothetical protein [Xanthomonas sp. BRIP62411]